MLSTFHSFHSQHTPLLPINYTSLHLIGRTGSQFPVFLSPMENACTNRKEML